jgi:cyclopropane fatty-acyl-phospholipid synthase-like methyltransferase
MKRFSPAAERNKSPIVEVLKNVLPQEGRILEISSGSGQHVVFFAEAFPDLTWQPSELEQESLESIGAYIGDSGLKNINQPILIDAVDTDWHNQDVAAVINCNMIHISPWPSCIGLFRGASQVLKRDGVLFLYGPFLIEGQPTAPSNLEFDASLRYRNPEWGIRQLESVIEVGKEHGFILTGVVSMPANNYSVVFKKT